MINPGNLQAGQILRKSQSKEFDQKGKANHELES
jgi:hypothetical protein